MKNAENQGLTWDSMPYQQKTCAIAVSNEHDFQLIMQQKKLVGRPPQNTQRCSQCSSGSLVGSGELTPATEKGKGHKRKERDGGNLNRGKRKEG